MTVNLFGMASLELSALKCSPGEIFAEISFSEFEVMIKQQIMRFGNNTGVWQQFT